MKKKLLFGLAIIFGLVLLTGCEKKEDVSVDDEIVSFHYSYGSYNGGYYDYDITTQEDKVRFVAKGTNGVDLDEDKEIDKSVLTELSEVVIKNKINDWDGFNESDKDVQDGYSFTLVIEYESGKTVNASGYHKYPDNYNGAHEKLAKFLKEIK